MGKTHNIFNNLEQLQFIYILDNWKNFPIWERGDNIFNFWGLILIKIKNLFFLSTIFCDRFLRKILDAGKQAT